MTLSAAAAARARACTSASIACNGKDSCPGAGVGAGVGVAVGLCVGLVVGTGVGVGVGDAVTGVGGVGFGVGLGDGDGVGACEGVGVGAGVGYTVGRGLGGAVGEALGQCSNTQPALHTAFAAGAGPHRRPSMQLFSNAHQPHPYRSRTHTAHSVACAHNCAGDGVGAGVGCAVGEGVGASVGAGEGAGDGAGVGDGVAGDGGGVAPHRTRSAGTRNGALSMPSRTGLKNARGSMSSGKAASDRAYAQLAASGSAADTVGPTIQACELALPVAPLPRAAAML